jgi:SHS2 domain-containing protein
MPAEFGFREHAHTADWELEVWAPDLSGLLEQAARGMYALAGMRLQPELNQVRMVALQADDAESLLVRFLSELLWLEQEQKLGFDRFAIKIDEQLNLQASLEGSAITNLDKEIKAVTYHNLQVEHTPQGLRANIVFDV